ncbi:MAG: 2-amino-4-hydroxy-6-hydroxymethyldihydropteridine diphosphokinase [Muribaculaceae bacterium]|nr:2-amino-4-hydroxy-6-hydroxymethyldihydropteridine diphosphokinase [Muribaculaceae bacterium]
MFFISLGTNVVNGRTLLQEALRSLAAQFPLRRVSTVTSSPALNPAHPAYLNAVASFDNPAGLTADDINCRLKEIEKSLLRLPCPASGCVAIDLDLVILNGEILRPKDYERSYFAIPYSQCNNQ